MASLSHCSLSPDTEHHRCPTLPSRKCSQKAALAAGMTASSWLVTWSLSKNARTVVCSKCAARYHLEAESTSTEAYMRLGTNVSAQYRAPAAAIQLSSCLASLCRHCAPEQKSGTQVKAIRVSRGALVGADNFVSIFTPITRLCVDALAS